MALRRPRKDEKKKLNQSTVPGAPQNVEPAFGPAGNDAGGAGPVPPLPTMAEDDGRAKRDWGATMERHDPRYTMDRFGDAMRDPIGAVTGEPHDIDMAKVPLPSRLLLPDVQSPPALGPNINIPIAGQQEPAAPPVRPPSTVTPSMVEPENWVTGYGVEGPPQTAPPPAAAPPPPAAGGFMGPPSPPPPPPAPPYMGPTTDTDVPTTRTGQPTAGGYVGPDYDETVRIHGAQSDEARAIRRDPEWNRSQSVARSAAAGTLDDPRMQHLPTSDEYEENLAVRRFGSGFSDAVEDKMDAEPMLTRANAVKIARQEWNMANRDALAVARGQETPTDKRERLAGLHEERFEEAKEAGRTKREARAQRKVDVRTRKDKERAARRAGFRSVAEHERHLAETRALGASERIAEGEQDIKRQELKVGEKLGEAQIGSTEKIELDKNALSRHIAGMEDGRARDALTFAMKQHDDDVEIQRHTLNQNAAVAEANNRLKDKELNLQEWALAMQSAGAPVTRESLRASAENLLELGVYTDLNQAMMAVASAAAIAEQVAGELGAEKPPRTRTGDRGGDLTLDRVDPKTGKTIEPAPAPAPPPAAPATTPAPAEPEAEPAADVRAGVDNWLEPTRNIRNTFFGMFGEGQAEEAVLKTHFKSMDNTAKDIIALSKDNPEEASRIATEILTRMTSGEDDWTYEASSGLFSGAEQDMTDAKQHYVTWLSAISGGDFSDHGGWARSISGLGINRDTVASTSSPKGKTQTGAQRLIGRLKASARKRKGDR